MQTREKKVKREKGKVLKLLILSLIPFCLSLNATAQCAMCRAALESSGDNAKVEAVNDGIVFLMAIPYILVAGIGFVVYKMYYKKK
jgi:heme/copper-type cytochrome/quinol oxidase subunit 2